jgi:hypothetical protein
VGTLPLPRCDYIQKNASDCTDITVLSKNYCY